MKTLWIPLEQCNPGDIIARDVFNCYGSILVAKNTSVNEFIIDKLTSLGVDRVNIYADEEYFSENRVHPILSRLENQYKKGILTTKRLITDLTMGRPLDQELLFDMCQSIFKNQNESYYVLKCIDDLKNSDDYTYIHSLNVGFYSMLLAKWLDLSDDEIFNTTQAGLLHDIGKIKVDKQVLNKEGKLTDEEFNEIKLHTVHGFNIIKDISDISYEVKKTVLMHHEREDGSGYPLHSKSSLINMYTKIVAITDVYDAMTSKRVYKNGVTPFEAFKMFKTTGLTLFDTHITNVFLTNMSINLTGMKITLPSGGLGEVMYVPPHDITNPVILYDSKYLELASL